MAIVEDSLIVRRGLDDPTHAVPSIASRAWQLRPAIIILHVLIHRLQILTFELFIHGTLIYKSEAFEIRLHAW